MALEESILMVRHGEYDRDTGRLIAEGQRQGDQALGEVAAYGFGADALILSSSAERTVQMAGIIGEGLGGSIVTISERLRVAGNYPGRVGDLDGLLSEELGLSNLNDVADRGLVVVTHGPMIAAARRMVHASLDEAAPYGGVFPYTPGSWISPVKQLFSRA